MRLANNTDCSTHSLRGLDDQILFLVNRDNPGMLSSIAGIPGITVSGPQVHTVLQAPAAAALKRAVDKRGAVIVINSALRTIAGQQLLRQHYENGRCNIKAAARPGASNHNNATALDIQDSEIWRSYLQRENWKWIGDFDPMHYDYVGPGKGNTVPAQIKAFQLLHNLSHPYDKLAVDGDMGPATLDRLKSAPIEGYPATLIKGMPGRFLRQTTPIQIGEDVKYIQNKLIEAEIRCVPDGSFGPDTDRAVKEFQSRNNISVDGQIGPKTRALLEAVTKK